jgi:hypothetical protein
MNVKDRLAIYSDKDQGSADNEFLVRPLLEGMAELSSCEDLPPALRARAFLSLLKDRLFDERLDGHLSALRSALRMLDPEQSGELTPELQADLAAGLINSAHNYIGKYESETEAELKQLYEPLAHGAILAWKKALQTLPAQAALAHLCEVEFTSASEALERLAAEMTSHHYKEGHQHTTPESFRDTVLRLAPHPKIF